MPHLDVPPTGYTARLERDRPMTSRPRLARHGPGSRVAERRPFVDPVSYGFLRATVSNTRRMITNAMTTQKLSLIHISEPTRLGMISYAVFCLKKKKKN